MNIYDYCFLDDILDRKGMNTLERKAERICEEKSKNQKHLQKFQAPYSGINRQWVNDPHATQPFTKRKK